MAYALPSFSAAANYAASFRPVKPVEGFENVKSDVATNLLASIPGQNQKMGLAMARDALQQQSTLRGIKYRQDAQTERTEKRIDAEKSMLETRLKANKRAAMMRRLGSMGSMMSGGGVARRTASGSSAAAAGRNSLLDPMKQLVSFERLDNELTRNARGRVGEVDEMATTAIKGMPTGAGGSAVAPASISAQGAYSAPTPGSLGNLESGLDSEQLEALKRKFEQQGG